MNVKSTSVLKQLKLYSELKPMYEVQNLKLLYF